MDLLERLYNQMVGWLQSLFKVKPVRLAIVRRYEDANGNYVGELYLEQEQKGVFSYRMIGASLDSMPFEVGTLHGMASWLDTHNDFLAYMPENRIRVGALDPKDNDAVRLMVAKLPKRNMSLTVQNGFIEHVMEKRV